ncbi:hypothetical protein ABPG74_022788 [Tetrahymena malaccensis]
MIIKDIKKDVIQKEEPSTSIYQQLITDNQFEPFGSFYTIGRHFNPITQDQLEQFYMKEIEKDKTDEDYFQNITRKTKEDSEIFDPNLVFNPVIEDTVFSQDNIVDFDDNINYKEIKEQNSKNIINKETLQRKYLYLFKIRCLLYQPTDLLQCEQKQKFKMYEFASFDLYRMKDSKVLDEVNLTLDFVMMTVQMTKEGKSIDPKFNFKEIEGANAGYVNGELYLTVKQRESNTSVIKFKAKYSFQRDLIVEVLNLVNHFCKKYPKKATTTYNNDDANLHRQEHDNKLEILKIRRTKLSIIKSDNIIPPKAILSYNVKYQQKDKPIQANFTVGINNIVIHSAQYMEDKLQPEQKNKAREKKLYDIIYSVIPFNNCYLYYDQGEVPQNKQLKLKINSQELQFEFDTSQAVQNIIAAIQGIQNGQILSDQIYIHISTKYNEKQSQIKDIFYKAKSKEINKLINYHKNIINQLQSAKTLLDFEYYKDFEAYVQEIYQEQEQQKNENKIDNIEQQIGMK